MTRRLVVTGGFHARDSSGRMRKVVELTWKIDATTMASHAREEIDGMRAYRLVDGTPVNEIKDGEYEIVSTGERIYRQ